MTSYLLWAWCLTFDNAYLLVMNMLIIADEFIYETNLFHDISFKSELKFFHVYMFMNINNLNY